MGKSARHLMTSDEDSSILSVTVREQSFELPSSLVHQLMESSSPSPLTQVLHARSDKHGERIVDIDPSIFTAYLLFIQSGYFVRPAALSDDELLGGLRLCGAPPSLLKYYEENVLFTAPHLLIKKGTCRRRSIEQFSLLGLLLSTALYALDLYRQMLILTKNSFQETSQTFTVIVYVVDILLLLFTSLRVTLTAIHNGHRWKQWKNNPEFIVDVISCLG